MKHKKLLAATMVASALLASSNSYAKEDTVVVNDNFEPKSSTADIDAKLKVQMKLDSIEKSKQKSNVDISEATEEYDFMNLPVWDENTGKILNPSKNKIKGTITGAARQVIGDGETLTITTNTADVKNNDSVLNGGAIYNELGTLNINGSSETIEISGNTADNESNFCTYGGAIYNAGTATITNAKFTSNRARRSGGYDISYGGAISNADYEYTDANVKMVINNTIFGDPDDPTKGNIARTGGAIYNSDEEHLADIPGYEDYATKITLNNTSFYYNKAESDSPPNFGGAINNAAQMEFNGETIFKGNSATGTGANGGAIYNNAPDYYGEYLRFNGSVTFDSNTATDSGETTAGATGGAIFNAYDANITFNNMATFTNNKTITGGNLDTAGGAIFNQNGGVIDFTNGASFTGNEATYGAAIYNDGGTITLNDANFANNLAGKSGGAIFNAGGTVTINAINSDVLFNGNTANGIANDIANSGGTLNINAAASKNVTLNGGITGGMPGTLNVNAADSKTGKVTVGNVLANQNVTVSKGTLNFAEGTKVSNSSITNAGSITADSVTFTGNSATYGGAIANDGASASATISNSTFNSNTSTKSGGAIDIDSGASVTINSGTKFLNNSAGKHAGAIESWDGTLDIIGETANKVVFTNNTAVNDGGAILASSASTVNIDNALFNTNEAGESGGAMATSAALTINNTTFDGNISHDGGGAIYNYATAGYVNMNDSVVKNNESTSGGGLFLLSRTAKSTIDNVEFTGNKATEGVAEDGSGGGAILVGSEAHVAITNGSNFTSNTSQTRGGAITTRETAQNNTAMGLTIADAVFTNNSAVTTGGAVYANVWHDANGNDGAKISNSTFTSNSANDGGAIYNDAAVGKVGHLIISDSNFTSNSATSDGGAIYNAGTAVINGNQIFKNNTAGGLGGAIYNTGTATINGSGLFTGNKANYVTASNYKANDIYNAGTLNLNAGADDIISLEGGIDGSAGTLNINSADTNTGLVEINGIKNQTATVSYGELAIKNGVADGSNLSGSTVNVGANATINTIDSVINNYSDKIKLTSGATVKADINLDGSIDRYQSVSDDAIEVAILAEVTGGTAHNTEIQFVQNGVTVTTDSITYQDGNKIAITGSGNNDGKIKLTTASGFKLSDAVEDTSAIKKEAVVYDLSNNETFDAQAAAADRTIAKADFVIQGEEDAQGNKTELTAAAGAEGIIVANDSKLTVDNVEFKNFAEDGGAIENRGSLIVTNAIFASTNKIAVENYGKYVSDPSIYEAGVMNYKGATFTVTDDIFRNIDRTGENGGAIFNEAAAGLTPAGEITLNNVTAYNNQAENGGFIYNAGNATINGGTFGINNDDPLNPVASGNNAVLGGAFYNADTGVMTITDAIIQNNSATTAGGAIWNAGTVSVVANAVSVDFSNNTANAAANDIHNTGTLNLNAVAGKTLTINGGISGNGATTINSGAQTGTVVFNGDVTNNVTVNTGTLDNNAELSGDLTVNAGGIVYSTAANLTGDVTNAGTINLEGNALRNIDGATGTTVLQDTIAMAANATIEGTLDLNGQTVNMQDGTPNYNTLAVGSLDATNGGSLKIDVDMTNNGAGKATANDKINITDGANNAGTLTLASVNVNEAGDPSAVEYADYITYVDGVTAGLTIDDTAIGTITSDFRRFDFTTGSSAGKLSVTISDTQADIDDFIQGYDGATPITAATYSLTGNKAVTTDLGTTARVGDTPNHLYLHLNDYVLSSDGHEGATVANGYTLDVDSTTTAGTITGFDTALATNATGTLNVENVTFIDNDGSAINNAGTATITGSAFGDGTAGNANTGVNGGAINNSGTLTLNDTSFNTNTATGLGGAIYSTGNVTINAINSAVAFAGNTDSTGANDVYMLGAAGSPVTLAINAADDTNTVTLTNIAGNFYNIDINKNGAATSTVASGNINGANTVTVGSGIVTAGTVTSDAIKLDGGTLTAVGDVTTDTLNTAAGTTLTANGTDLNVMNGINKGTINGTAGFNVGDGVNDASYTNQGIIANAITIADNASLTSGTKGLTSPTDITNTGTLILDNTGVDPTVAADVTLNSGITGATGETFILGTVKTPAGKAILQATVDIGDTTGAAPIIGSLENSGTITATNINVNTESEVILTGTSTTNGTVNLKGAGSEITIQDGATVAAMTINSENENAKVVIDAENADMNASTITALVEAGDNYILGIETNGHTVTLDGAIDDVTAVEVYDNSQAIFTDTALNSNGNANIVAGNNADLTIDNTAVGTQLTVTNAITAATAADAYTIEITNSGNDSTILANTISGATSINVTNGSLGLNDNSNVESTTDINLANATELNIDSADSLTIANDITVTGAADVNINANGGTGNVTYDGTITNADVNVAAGTLTLGTNSVLDGTDVNTAADSTVGWTEGASLTNGATVNVAADATFDSMDGTNNALPAGITLADDSQIKADINVVTGLGDNFSLTNAGDVVVSDLSLTGLDKIVYNNTDINLTDALGLNNATGVAIKDSLQNKSFKAMTPIRIMEATVDNNGMMNIHPSSGSNAWRDFNPAVLATPVAAQLGGYLSQLQSYDEAFRNLDMYMLMPRAQRIAMKMRNKYAAADADYTFDPTSYAVEKTGAWFRPYATFENVPLKNGPSVTNVAYGSYFGGDSGLKELGHGWDGMWGAYVGYNGSHQTYDSVGIYQNGGTLGAVGMAFKNNFFAGITLNVGANVGEASTKFGQDDFTMLMAGIAAKTGYNWELVDGKFIIQPSLQMSYSFVNTFDYRNAAGVNINSDPLNAIQIEPGIKFIGNLKNGWQPYAGVSVVINAMDKANFRANDIALPSLSVDPYVKYGLGVRKSWGERLTGFFQTFITNGGRNGVGVQFGFRYAIGNESSGVLSKKANSIPELKKTTVSLSCLNNK